MDGSDDHEADEPLETRECRQPTLEDLIFLAKELNARQAKFVIVGGFAIIQAGYARQTMDIDLLVEVNDHNERAVLDAVEMFPDGAAKEIMPGEVGKYDVVRIADEVMIDLMKSGCGVTYADAIKDAVWRELEGVRIPFASKTTLWKMKQTHREKDIPDRIFLAKALTDEGIPLDPPPRENTSDVEVPPWLKKVLRWFAARARK